MDDIAVLVAEALARRVKEARARQALATPGAPGPAASAPKPSAAKPPAAPAAPAAATSAPAPAKAAPRPAPPRPSAAPAPGGDGFFAMPLDASHLPATVPLLEAFASPGGLLAAFVLHEALGKPVALREDGPHF